MSDLLGSTLGKYRLVAQLGRGGYAEVYLAYQRGLDRYVAVKVLRPHIAEEENFISRFEREAAAIAHLRHPNIVQVHDFDAAEGVYYMVMEFVDGPSLSAELYERRQHGWAFKPVELAHVFTRLSSALDYAHARGVVHQDLKPANIMFSSEGQVVLTDFGIAHILGRAGLTPQGVVGTPAYMAPEQGQGAPGDRRSDVYSLGVILYELVTGRLPFPGGDAQAIIEAHQREPVPAPSTFTPEMPEALEQIILKALSKVPEYRYASAGDLAAALRDALNVTAQDLARTAKPFTPVAAGAARPDEAVTPLWVERPLPPCPYRGLFAFREEDAPFFFGREDFTDLLFKAVQTENQPLAAVIGPSGSGKSSVVSAGLLPRLRQGQAMRLARGQSWAIAAFRPGPQPFHALAAELLDLQQDVQPAAEERRHAVREIAEALRQGHLQLREVVELLLRANPDFQRMLVVVDQFEELYTLCPEIETRRAFLDMLLDSSRPPRAGSRFPVTLLLTMRADFLGQMLSHRPFADALQDNSLILGPMTHDELREAIENPARKQGVLFQSGLIERLLDDVGEQPGNLPLLEFALTALWERQTENRLTHAAYDSIGHVEGALARYADQVYQALAEPDQDRARRVFVQLVRPGESTEDIRRQATRADLEAQWPLVQQLADARLVVTSRDPGGQETVEVVHEALTRSWGRLREWMRADRTFRAWQERLRAALHQWEVSGRDDGALLRGALLVGAEGWLAEREAELGQAERDFIHAGAALREREASEREAARQRELEAARRVAEAERHRAEEQTRAARQVRLPTAALAVALTISVLALAASLFAAGTAVQSRRAAEATASAALIELTQTAAQMRLAQAHELAAASLASGGDDPELSLLLAMAAVSETYNVDGTWIPEAEAALRQALIGRGGHPEPGLTIPQLLEMAQGLATRSLTPGECRQYLHVDTCPAE